MRQLQGQEEWKEEYNENCTLLYCYYGNIITVCYFIVIYGHILYTCYKIYNKTAS